MNTNPQIKSDHFLTRLSEVRMFARVFVALFIYNLNFCNGMNVSDGIIFSQYYDYDSGSNSNYTKQHGDYGNIPVTKIDPATIGSDCIDRKGKRVPVGEDYHPERDSPCTICECRSNKQRKKCSSVGCDALECLHFNIDEDSCCGYTCHSSDESYGNLDVQQVGSNSVIIQWTLKKKKAYHSDTFIMLAYRAGFEDKSAWIQVPVQKNEDSTMVSGLQPGVEYTFKGVTSPFRFFSPPRSLKAAQITLETRVGNSLRLEQGTHDRKIFIHKNDGQGQFKWPPVLYINLNAFDYVKVDHKLTRNGKKKNILRLYNIGSRRVDDNIGDLNMQFSDIKLFRWALAHL